MTHPKPDNGESLSDLLFKKLPKTVAPSPLADKKKEAENTAAAAAQQAADEPEDFITFFYGNLPAKAGQFPPPDPARQRAAFNNVAAVQDQGIDSIAHLLPDHPDVTLARQLVNLPSMRACIATGLAATHFGETMPARTFGFLLAAGLVDGAENRSEIIVGHGFDRQVTAAVQQLISLNAWKDPAQDGPLPYDRYSQIAQRLFLAGIEADMRMAYNPPPPRADGSTIPMPEINLDHITGYILRHTNRYGPYDESRSDRGEMKMLNALKDHHNLLARKMGSTTRLAWNMGVLTRTEFSRPGAKPAPQ